MSLIKIFAYTAILAGIGVLLTGTFRDVGFVLLVEGGVLFTLVEKNHRQDSRPRDRSV